MRIIVPSCELRCTSSWRAVRLSSASKASSTSSGSAGMSGSASPAIGRRAPATERAQLRPSAESARYSRVAARREADCWPSR